MDVAQRSSMHPAPLSVNKTSNGFITGAESTIQSAKSDIEDYQRRQVRMTPPLTPRGSREAVKERMDDRSPVFHNYLRAFYQFSPAEPVSPSTITLPFDHGDVILIHSVHTNGWADGTQLETGERGWLPTNYCEPFDPVPIRHLLKALTEFWDTIRNASISKLEVFKSQDYMRGLIAGVRFLLENSKCLTRDTALVKGNDSLRRVRKALLSDLSALVKIARRLQDIANGLLPGAAFDELLDEMLLKAFKIVTRAVVFLDVWNDANGPPEQSNLAKPKAGEAPLTPPADVNATTLDIAPLSGQADIVFQTISSTQQIPRSRDRSPSEASTSTSAPSVQSEVADQRASRISAPPRKRTSVSHRVSYGGRSAARSSSKLVSVRLGQAYDAFLGVLGSFIGLHLQSRSSSELLVTTQQAVKSCKRLLLNVEIVMKHNSHRSDLLRKAKENLVDKVTDLARVAQNAFHPFSDDLVFMPDDGKRLVDAATTCVRAAGECVAHTRLVLEQIGDFELDDLEKPASSAATSQTNNGGSRTAPASHDATGGRQTPLSSQAFVRPVAPRLLIPNSVSVPSTSTSTSTLNPASQRSTSYETSNTATDTPISTISTISTIPFAMQESPPTPPPKQKQHTPVSIAKSSARTVASTGSHSTFIGSARGSELSGHSASTAATSVGHSSSQDVTGERFSGSHTTLTDDCDETESKVLETTFAHEICTKDGRIIGGTLRSLIERLTAYDSAPDSEFIATFYLTFRLFATPLTFAKSLADRFEYVGESTALASPVRLRVYNTLKGWLESHWRHDCDKVAIPFILEFNKKTLMPSLPSAGRRLLELIEKVSTVSGPVMPRLVSSIGRTNTAIGQYVNPDAPLPTPIISKSQLAALKNWREGGSSISVLDFDPLELARQFTIKDSQIFCSILPEELLATEWMKQSGSLAVNVRAMSRLSTDLANLVADCILQQEDPKKRAAVIKQWIKIAKKCLDLNNYDTLMAIHCALTNSTIRRMNRTWELVSAKQRATLEMLGSVVDVSKNHTALRQRLQNLMPPCLPFVGMYLTDLTFVDHGNPATRQLLTTDNSMSVINFDKHVKTAKIISDLQRFQVPYRFTEVPELQTWMQDQLVRVRSSGDKIIQNFYRRSLVLEPKDAAMLRKPAPVNSMPMPSTSKHETKDFFDFLNRHRDKTISTH